MFNHKIVSYLRDTFYIVLAVLSASFGLKGFLVPNRFIDGGVTGISLLVHFLTGINLPVLVLVINIPFLFLGYKLVAKGFAIKTLVAIVLLDICLLFINFPIITSDKLLIAMFGGFFLGAGIGLAIRGGAVIDGTEILALFISRKTRFMVGYVILFFNIIIFAVAAFLINIETAMYAILTYFAASRTLNFIVNGLEEYTGVTIISEESAEIRKVIIDTMGRGVTVYQGKRGLSDAPQDIIYTVVTRLEVPRLLNAINVLDPNAFIIQQNLSDIKGGVVKQRRLTA